MIAGAHALRGANLGHVLVPERFGKLDQAVTSQELGAKSRTRRAKHGVGWVDRHLDREDTLDFDAAALLVPVLVGVAVDSGIQNLLWVELVDLGLIENAINEGVEVLGLAPLEPIAGFRDPLHRGARCAGNARLQRVRACRHNVERRRVECLGDVGDGAVEGVRTEGGDRLVGVEPVISQQLVSVALVLLLQVREVWVQRLVAVSLVLVIPVVVRDGRHHVKARRVALDLRHPAISAR